MKKPSAFSLVPALVVTALSLALGPSTLWAAGGSSSAPVAPSLTPEQMAVEAYNRGLAHRDKAWKVMEGADSLEGKALEKVHRKALKEFEKAVRAFEAAVDDNPNMYQAHSSLGYALRKLGRYDESLTAYDRALSIEPAYTEAIEYRAEAYLGLNRLDEAKDAYMELFRSDREKADELMAAMQDWIEKRRSQGDVEDGVVDEFATWVAERDQASRQAADLGTGSATSWTGD